MASPGAPTATRATASSFARVPRWQREWLAASLGCTVADTIFNPLEVLKVRRQIAVASTTAASAAPSSSASSSTLGLARSAIAERGLLRGLWLPGLEATCYRAFSYTGFRIGMYPSVRDAVARTLGGGDERASSGASASGASSSSLPSRLAAGALTGAIGSAVFNPIDVVRVRQQGATPYPSTLGAFVEVARSEGVVSGLYRGLGACVLRAAMLSGSQLATYDTAKRWLRGDEGSPWAARGSPWAVPEGPALHFAASFLSGVVAQTATQPWAMAIAHATRSTAVAMSMPRTYAAVAQHNVEQQSGADAPIAPSSESAICRPQRTATIGWRVNGKTTHATTRRREITLATQKF